MLLFLVLLHALVGYVELGTDSWIANLMTNIAGMKGILVLVYTSGIMFLLRFFAQTCFSERTRAAIFA